MAKMSGRTALIGGISSLALLPSVVFAQQNEPQVSPLPAEAVGAEPVEADPENAIVATGSRIARRDYSATSPIVAVGEAFLDTQAGATFGVKLQQLSQVTPGGNELIGNGQPTGRASVDLRGLGPTARSFLPMAGGYSPLHLLWW